jgi:hypothetical protein
VSRRLDVSEQAFSDVPPSQQGPVKALVQSWRSHADEAQARADDELMSCVRGLNAVDRAVRHHLDIRAGRYVPIFTPPEYVR